MTVTGTDNNFNKIPGDMRILPSSEIQPAIIKDKNLEKTGKADVMENDGSNVNSSKGKIPAAGVFSFGASGAVLPPYVKDIEDLIQSLSGDKQTLGIILSAIEDFDISQNPDSLSDKDLMGLLMLGLDVKAERGQLVIRDNSGNKINLEDFVGIQSNLKESLKRAIAGSASSVARAASAVNIKTDDSELIQKLSNSINSFQTEMDRNDKEVEPTNTELKKNLQEYDSLIQRANQQSDKVDKNIEQIKTLKLQAESIVDKGKSNGLNTVEKKQLISLMSTIDLKQKELVNNYEGSVMLMKEADAVFSKFSDKLNPSEKNTMEEMQNALKSRISGQGLSVRQNFLASMSEDIYKLTANMSSDEVENLSKDPSSRVKLLSSTNKFLDKLISATQLSDLSQQDQDTLWTKFKIRAVDEGGQLSFYYYANGKSDAVKVSKEELRVLKTDLNNIVTSPELFNLARAMGEISMAYNTDKVSESASVKGSVSNEKGQPYQTVDPSKSDTKLKTPDINNFDEEVNKKLNRWSEQSSLDKNIERKREEEKYHEQQINNIHARRSEINRDLENERIEKRINEQN